MGPTHDAPPSVVVLGGGVIGLSVALTVRERFPSTNVTIIAEYFPGDYHVDFCSPWAGANWCSSATDNGLLESFDRVTFDRFKEIAHKTPEAGIKRSPLRMLFDSKIEDAQILSKGTEKVWYDELVGGLASIDKGQLPTGAVFGLDAPSTFVINTQIYLQWLLDNCRRGGVTLLRRRIDHIDQARLNPKVTAVFNCTGLGSYSLGGVADRTMYPTRGQTVLVEQPLQPLTRMYFRSPRRVDNNTTYVFQRPLGGGVVLGGCRQNGNWDGKVDPEFSKEIIRKCCALAPELGKPEDLKVIKHGVGLRPGREAGPRVELEKRHNGLVIHNYGAGGTGYQGSWGMAGHAVMLLEDHLKSESSRESKL